MQGAARRRRSKYRGTRKRTAVAGVSRATVMCAGGHRV